MLKPYSWCNNLPLVKCSIYDAIRIMNGSKWSLLSLDWLRRPNYRGTLIKRSWNFFCLELWPLPTANEDQKMFSLGKGWEEWNILMELLGNWSIVGASFLPDRSSLVKR